MFLDDALSKQDKSITVFFFAATFTPLLGAYHFTNVTETDQTFSIGNKERIKAKLASCYEV